MPDLAAALHRSGGPLRSLPPLAVDTGIAVICYAATVVFPLMHRDSTWWVYPVAALATLPLVWRRRFPVLVASVTGTVTTWLSLTDKISRCRTASSWPPTRSRR